MKAHELISKQDGLEVCDIACGAGHSGFSFKDRASKIVFCDPAKNMLKIVEERTKELDSVEIDLFETVAEKLPLLDKSFDLVISRLAPHHFNDPLKAVSEMKRVIKPGGLVCIIDLSGYANVLIDSFNHDIECLHDPTHVRSYTVNQWHKYFTQAGLIVNYAQDGFSESSDGVPIKKWCEIANSGVEAEKKIRIRLKQESKKTLAQMGIWQHEGEYYMPIRTMMMCGMAE